MPGTAEHVDAVELFCELPRHGADVGEHGEVGRDGVELRLVGALRDEPCRGVERALPGRSVQHDERAGRGQLARGLEADGAVGASHDDGWTSGCDHFGFLGVADASAM